MKTNWQRNDPLIRFLFAQESLLLKAFKEKNGSDIKNVLGKLKLRFDELRDSGIANSRGLDHFLQVAMTWITTYLGSCAEEPSFRATVSLYLPKLNAILVKPCLVYPGRCTAPQPTISLKADPLADRGAIGYRGAVGHTGLAMASGEILYCRRAVTQCEQYIPLESERRTTDAALCIPLKGDFKKLRKTFDKELSAKGEAPCSLQQQCHNLNPDPVSILKEDKEDRTVLNIECISNHLDGPEKAQAWLADEEFSEVIKQMIETVAEYQKQRPVHRALEHSSTLLALATNTLNPRSAYRALLREISVACDGADVTLHLRDLFDSPDEEETERNHDRCSIFVAGVGSNFRDFLVNERIGLKSGQIGWALKEDGAPASVKVTRSNLRLPVRRESGEEQVLVQYIVGTEIEDSLAGEKDALPFKQLMPKTFLNVTVPIYFHDLKIGVINIEWDKEHLAQGFSSAELGLLPPNIPSEGRKQVENYLYKCLPLVYRMADYLSLVIDYYDDVKNLADRPSPEQLSDKKFVEKLSRDSALRKFMKYYMEWGMDTAQKLAKRRDIDDLKAEKECLKDLVDPVGYFLASTHTLRILVSVRRTAQDKKGLVLRHHVSHWLEGGKDDKDSESRKADIEIGENKSVLSTSAYHGVPLFGEIKGTAPNQWLQLDSRCKELLQDSRYPERPDLEKVPYRPAGQKPRYEVGVPLVFGRRMLGTFDFELFEREKTDEKPQFEDRDLCAHLEWGRAISFLIAYLEHAREDARKDAREDAKEDAKSATQMNDAHRDAFKRFQVLCAQLIAEVPVGYGQLLDIATDSFSEIIPVKNAQVKELPAVINANQHIDLLRFRGAGDQAMSWETGELRGALLDSLSEAARGKTVTAMMTSYQSLIQNLPSHDPVEDDFLRAIDQIVRDLERERTKLVENSHSAGDAAFNVFFFLHELLSRYLASQVQDSGGDPLPSRYAWFLHIRQFDPRTQCASYISNIQSSRLPKRERVPLAYCYTEEMVDILKRKREKVNKDGKSAMTALCEVLKERSHDESTDFIEDIKKSLLTTSVTDRDIINALTTALTRPILDEEERLSFTLSVARPKLAIVVPNINLSPNRSRREHEWFWKEPYTVLGIPFMFNEECVAVLNVFRRRDSHNDMKFFRIEERNKAEEMAEKVVELLLALLHVEKFDQVEDDSLKSGLSNLSRELEVLESNKAKKLIVIQSPFASSRESFETLCNVLFGESAPSERQNQVRFPDEERSYVNRVVVARVGKEAKENLEKFGQDIGLLTKYARRVYLFVSRREDIIPSSSVPAYAADVSSDQEDRSLLREDPAQEDLYYRWLLGKAIWSLQVGKSVIARFGPADREGTHEAFRKWLRDRRHVSERADFYAALDHLDKSSWRPDKDSFALASWSAETEKTGEQP